MEYGLFLLVLFGVIWHSGYQTRIEAVVGMQLLAKLLIASAESAPSGLSEAQKIALLKLASVDIDTARFRATVFCTWPFLLL